LYKSQSLNYFILDPIKEVVKITPKRRSKSLDIDRKQVDRCKDIPFTYIDYFACLKPQRQTECNFTFDYFHSIKMNFTYRNINKNNIV
jgi:hypothetical protein